MAPLIRIRFYLYFITAKMIMETILTLSKRHTVSTVVKRGRLCETSPTTNIPLLPIISGQDTVWAKVWHDKEQDALVHVPAKTQNRQWDIRSPASTAHDRIPGLKHFGNNRNAYIWPCRFPRACLCLILSLLIRLKCLLFITYI